MRQIQQVILIAGKKGAGKDTAARAFVKGIEDAGFKSAVIHFAYPMKAGAMALLGVSMEELEEMKRNESKEIDLSSTSREATERYIIAMKEFIPWAKREKLESTLHRLKELRPKNVRQFLQFMGTEVFKREFYDHIWSEIAYKRIEKLADEKKVDFVVIPDFRFPGEYRFLLKRGTKDGRWVKPPLTMFVSRPGMERRKDLADSHASENALDDFPFHVVSSNEEKTPEDFQKRIRPMAKRLALRNREGTFKVGRRMGICPVK